MIPALRYFLPICLAIASTFGQERPIQVDRVNLDPDQLRNAISSDRLIPIKIDDLNQRIESTNGAVRPATAMTPAQVTYKATFNDRGSLEGTFDARLGVRRTPEKRSTQVVSLGKPGFTSFQLQTPALWGIDGTGAAIVVLDKEPADSLKGNWTLTGTPRTWGTDFVFEPLVSIASELFIELPPGLTLVSNSELVQANEEAEPNLYVIPSVDAPIRLSVVRRNPSATRAVPLVDVRTMWTLGGDNTRFQAEYVLQSDEPITGFSIPIPENTSVQSVSYGDAAALPIEISNAGSGQLLRIELPTPLLGSGRPFKLTAQAPPTVGRLWAVPALDAVACETVDGQTVAAVSNRVTQRLSIEAPLELQQLELEGFRQTESLFTLDGSHTISLSRIFADAKVTLRVDQARRERQYQVVTRITPESDVWKHRTIVVSDSALTGEVRLAVPTDFTVLAIHTGVERTPCDFRTEGEADSPTVRVFVPPTSSTILELTGHTKATPTGTVATIGGKLIGHSLVVLENTLVDSIESLPIVAADQLRAVLQDKLPPDFLAEDVAIIESNPGTVVALQKPVSSQPGSVPEPSASAQSAGQLAVPVKLSSVINPRPAPDVHTIEVRLENQETLAFELDAQAPITRILVNGRRTRFQRAGSVVAVPLDRAVARNAVEIRYESFGNPTGQLVQERVVPIPYFANSSGFSWDRQLPNHTTVRGIAPFESTMPESATWLNLLGPLLQASPGPDFGKPRAFPYVPERLTITTVDSAAVTRYAFLGTTVTLAVCVLIIRLTSPIWVCLAEATLALLCFLLPFPLGPIAGGCVLGGLAALLLSDLLRVDPPNRETSTTDTRPGRAAMQVGIALVVGTGSVNQAIGQDTFRAFGTAGQQTVYVKQELLNQLDATIDDTSSPRVLLQEAAYVAEVTPSTCVVRASIVAIMLDEEATTLSLPFANANVNNCEVDDVEVFFEKRADRILIPIPEPEEEPRLRPRTVTIRLSLYPPIRNGRCNLSIPPAASSTCALEAEDTLRHRLNGKTAVFDRAYPVSERILIETSTVKEGTGDREQTEFQNNCVIEVGSVESLVSHDLTVTPGSETLKHLDLVFPTAHRFGTLTVNVPAVHRVLQDGKKNHVAIDLDEPASAPVKIKLTLTARHMTSPEGRRIQLLPLIPGATIDTVTVTPRPGLELTSLVPRYRNAEPQPEPARSPVIQVGDPTTFSIDKAAELDFNLTSPKAIRECRLEQRVRVEAEQLDYSLKAELQIRNGPVFAHTLTVPAQLSIDTIVVRENGVDRLARYQRDGSRLLLLLEGRTSGTQNVEVRGRVARTLDSISAIPAIKVADADVRSSTLTIEKAADLSVTFEDTDGLPFAVRPDSAATQSFDDGEATIQLLTQTQLPVIRTVRQAAPRIATVCVARPTSGSEIIRYTWIYHLENSISPNQITVPLGGANLESDAGVLIDETQDGPAVVLTEAGTTFVVTVPGTRESVAQLQWPGNVVLTRRFLVIPTDCHLTESRGQLTDARLPAWAAPFVPGEADVFSGAESWELIEKSQAVSTEPASDRAQDMNARFVETIVWQFGVTTAGSTTVIPEKPGTVLRVRIPDGFRVEAVQLEGRKSKSHSVSGGTLSIPASGASYVSIRWRGKVDSGRFRVPFPSRLVGEACFVTHTSSAIALTNRDGVTAISLEDHKARRPAFLPELHADASARTFTFFDEAARDFNAEFHALATRSEAPEIGLGFVGGVLCFAFCFATQFLRTGLRMAVVAASIGTIVVILGVSPFAGTSLLVAAPLIWWLVPREM